VQQLVLTWQPASRTVDGAPVAVTAYRPREAGVVLATLGPGAREYVDNTVTPGAAYDVVADFADGTSVASAAKVHAASTAQVTLSWASLGLPAAVSSGSGSASGEAMPTGSLPADAQAPSGWTQVYAEDFLTPVGETAFTDTAFTDQQSRFKTAYPGTGAYRASWTNSVQTSWYSAGKTCSVEAGSSVLRQRLHTDSTGKHRTENLTPQGAAASQLYGRYKIRWRVPQPLPGYKVAWLLWPTTEVWPRDGEIDFPEGSMNAGADIEGYMHRQDATAGPDQDYRDSNVDVVESGWHTSEIIWAAGYCAFLLDGVMLGSPMTSRVPNTPMGWRIQTEGNLSGSASNTGISPATEGVVEIDWIVAYSRA